MGKILGLVLACSAALGAYANVQIDWTEYGVPHIEATDWHSLGYGYGYALSTQNFCILADQLLMIRSERAKYFGPGVQNSNLVSDIGTLALGFVEDAKTLFPTINPNTQDLIRGYAEGYNKYLSEKGAAGLPAPCTGATWATPTTGEELFAYYLTLAERASGEVLLPAIVNAQPPGGSGSLSNAPPQNPAALNYQFAPYELPDFSKLGLGSNAWGLGKDKTETGRGMLLGNPHFPAMGALRFYEAHLKIPGVYEVHGASILGTPVIEIGFNDSLAWSHTVSTSTHLTLYYLNLNPFNPRQYFYNGQLTDIQEKPFTISVLQPDGSLAPYTRSIFYSQYGPMILTPQLGWNNFMAYSYRDANAKNIDFIDEWIQMGMATNITQFKAAFQQFRGVPWVNTMYADKDGNALYIEGTPVPNLSQATLDAWNGNLIAQKVYSSASVFLLDGTGVRDQWQGDVRGLVPYSNAPQLTRTDYVINSNDSQWIINPTQPLVGYAATFGPEKTPLSYRTRMSLKMIQDQADPNGLFSLQQVEDAFFSDRSYLYELIGGDLKTRCAKWTDAKSQAACSAFGAWDGHFNLTSHGSSVFRELASQFDPSWHSIPFDSNDPANTPAGLNGPGFFSDPLKKGFAAAIGRLDQAGVAYTAALQDVQIFELPDFKGGTLAQIPYHGGSHPEGAFNVMGWAAHEDFTLYDYPEFDTSIINEVSGLVKGVGYPINEGASIVMFVQFTDQGPQAEGLLTYSQSSDPLSPNSSDQNYLYAQKKVRPFINDWNVIHSTATSTQVFKL